MQIPHTQVLHNQSTGPDHTRTSPVTRWIYVQTNQSAKTVYFQILKNKNKTFFFKITLQSIRLS